MEACFDCPQACFKFLISYLRSRNLDMPFYFEVMAFDMNINKRVLVNYKYAH